MEPGPHGSSNFFCTDHHNFLPLQKELIIIRTTKTKTHRHETIHYQDVRGGAIALSLVLLASCKSKEDPTVAVTGVSLDKPAVELTEGETTVLKATVNPSNATEKTIAWSSDNPSVAAVSNGTVTAVKAGSATVTVTTQDGGKTARCAVTVKAKTVAVTGISLNKASLTLTEGGSETLTAAVAPENATNQQVNWSSADNQVATVDNAGKVTAVKIGETTVKATTEDGGKTAECKVTVTKVAVSSITLSKSAYSLDVGQSIQLAATVQPDNASFPSLTWKSSNEAVATVDAGGLVKAVAPGTADITASADGITSKACVITVNEVEGIEIADVAFKNILLKIADADHNGVITSEEAAALKGISLNDDQVKDLAGIEHFNNIAGANIISKGLTAVDLSKNKKLKEIFIIGSSLADYNLSGLGELEKLELNFSDGKNQPAINLNGSTSKITYLKVQSAYLKSLDDLQINSMSHLKEFQCLTNCVESVVLTGTSALEYIDLSVHASYLRNALAVIDLSGCPELKVFLSHSSPAVQAIDFSKNTKLESVKYPSGMKEIDLSKLPATVRDLTIGDYGEEPSISGTEHLVGLEYLTLYGTSMTSLDLSNASALKSISIHNAGALKEIWLKQNSEVEVTGAGAGDVTIKYK
jgi:uncharacterized protein YjdB